MSRLHSSAPLLPEASRASRTQEILRHRRQSSTTASTSSPTTTSAPTSAGRRREAVHRRTTVVAVPPGRPPPGRRVWHAAGRRRSLPFQQLDDVSSVYGGGPSPTALCGRPSSATALSLLLQSSVFQELEARNAGAAEQPPTAAEDDRVVASSDGGRGRGPSGTRCTTPAPMTRLCGPCTTSGAGPLIQND
jgi:hypothetical protein